MSSNWIEVDKAKVQIFKNYPHQGQLGKSIYFLDMLEFINGL